MRSTYIDEALATLALQKPGVDQALSALARRGDTGDKSVAEHLIDTAQSACPVIDTHTADNSTWVLAAVLTAVVLCAWIWRLHRRLKIAKETVAALVAQNDALRQHALRSVAALATAAAGRRTDCKPRRSF